MNAQNTQEHRSISVETNSFSITKLPPVQYNQYTAFFRVDLNVVEFIPVLRQAAKRNRLFNFLQNQVAPDVFKNRAVYDDNSLAYCPALLKLPDGGCGTFDLGFTVPSGSAHGAGRVNQSVKITITRGEVVKPSSDVVDLITKKTMSDKALVATNLLQLIVRQRPNTNCKNARAYFPGKERFPIGNGHLEIWRGFFQSVRPTLGKMILTIDTCIAIIYAGGPLLSLCQNFAGVRNSRELNYKPEDVMFRQLAGFLDGVRITYRSGNRESKPKTIYGLVHNAGEYSFADNRNQEITVREYFKVAHGITLAHPSLIGVRISRKSAPNVVVIPVELCTVIPGQFFKKKLAEELTPQLLKTATLTPDQKRKKIIEAVKDCKKCEYVVESQMTVDINPLNARGKLLNPPQITYGNSERITPKTGAWNVMSKQLHTPTKLESWAVVNFCSDKITQQQCETYIDQLRHCCSKLGMAPERPGAICPGRGHAVAQSLDQTMTTARSNTKKVPRLLLVILPEQAGGIRREVKYWGDIKYGILTQCVRIDKFHNKRNNDQYWNNVALKINARLRGQNWIVDESPVMKQLAEKPFMIMGADVSHPAPSMNHPSTASAVYSFDPTATSYAALTRFQPPRVECILDLKEMIKLALERFKTRHKIYPQRLFFYRDGISEGEIENVAKKMEINDIKEALQELGANITLTYIIVTKRHHGVLFPIATSKETADGRGNCLPGTVVDQDITHPAMDDFYLQSHASVQGTSRSSHYIVVANENTQFNLERLQQLSYALCHLYAKATRTVSIPAPIYYAHLVCSRGMMHLRPEDIPNTDFDSNSVSSGTHKDRKLAFELQPWLDGFKDVNGTLKERMYFL